MHIYSWQKTNSYHVVNEDVRGTRIYVHYHGFIRIHPSCHLVICLFICLSFNFQYNNLSILKISHQNKKEKVDLVEITTLPTSFPYSTLRFPLIFSFRGVQSQRGTYPALHFCSLLNLIQYKIRTLDKGDQGTIWLNRPFQINSCYEIELTYKQKCII